jgi:hypothetical protein
LPDTEDLQNNAVPFYQDWGKRSAILTIIGNVFPFLKPEHAQGKDEDYGAPQVMPGMW